jgi:hypothetical protein
LELFAEMRMRGSTIRIIGGLFPDPITAFGRSRSPRPSRTSDLDAFSHPGRLARSRACWNQSAAPMFTTPVNTHAVDITDLVVDLMGSSEILVGPGAGF